MADPPFNEASQQALLDFFFCGWKGIIRSKFVSVCLIFTAKIITSHYCVLYSVCELGIGGFSVVFFFLQGSVQV
jgi:hypothetical protein